MKNKTENYKNQPRDDKGRFLSYDGTKNTKYSIHDVKKAYLAAANSSGGYLLPSKKWELYKRINNLE